MCVRATVAEGIDAHTLDGEMFWPGGGFRDDFDSSALEINCIRMDVSAQIPIITRKKGS